MARNEEPREDLLREATATVERVELKIESVDEPILVGFRRDGAASFYFGEKISYQFNTAGQLRRGYLDGRLYKAEAGRLVQLMCRRSQKEVALIRHECSEAEQQIFLSSARQSLAALHSALVGSRITIVGQVPRESDVAGKVRHWLTKHSNPIAFACSPNVI